MAATATRPVGRPRTIETDEEFRAKVGANIAVRRKSLRLTQAELSALYNRAYGAELMTQTLVSQVERGEHNADWATSLMGVLTECLVSRRIRAALVEELL